MALQARRATGRNVFFRYKFEASYGEQPGGNWRQGFAFSYGVSKSQELIDDPLLGAGPLPQRPERGPIDVTGPMVVPVDKRIFPFYLVWLMGDAVSTQVGARGFIEFTANPADTNTITLDGQVWTFVAGAPGANETQIQADLQATIDQLVSDLNGSAVPAIAAATYSRIGDRLVVEHDTADNSGDAYTLATGINSASVSKDTLYGGGLYRHVFEAGAVAVPPSLATEIEHSDIKVETDGFRRHLGLLLNSMQITRERSGSARATLDVIGQAEVTDAATGAGVPITTTVDRFSNFKGQFLVNGRAVANLTDASFTTGNNLEVVPGLRNDGLIDGADPGQVQLDLSLGARFSNNEVKQAVEAEAAIDALLGWLDPIDGAEIAFLLHQVDLPSPSLSIDGPGGIQVTYEGRGSQNQAGKALTVTVYNDQPAYTTVI